MRVLDLKPHLVLQQCYFKANSDIKTFHHTHNISKLCHELLSPHITALCLIPNFFRHKFKCLLEYLGTKDNIKLNCGIIVSPSYNRKTNLNWHHCSHLTIGMFFFSIILLFSHSGQIFFFFLILKRINIVEIYHLLFYESQKIFLNFLFQSYVP